MHGENSLEQVIQLAEHYAETFSKHYTAHLGGNPSSCIQMTEQGASAKASTGI